MISNITQLEDNEQSRNVLITEFIQTGKIVALKRIFNVNVYKNRVKTKSFFLSSIPLNETKVSNEQIKKKRCIRNNVNDYSSKTLVIKDASSNILKGNFKWGHMKLDQLKAKLALRKGIDKTVFQFPKYATYRPERTIKEYNDYNYSKAHHKCLSESMKLKLPKIKASKD